MSAKYAGFYPYNLMLDIFGTFQNFDIRNFDKNLDNMRNFTKISTRDIEIVKARYKENLSYRELSKRFNLTFQGISLAIRRTAKKITAPENVIHFLLDGDNEPQSIIKKDFSVTLSTPIEELKFSSRVENSLKSVSANTLSDVLDLSRTDFKNIGGLDKVGISEIQRKLSALNIPTDSDRIRKKLNKIKKEFLIDNQGLINVVKTL